MSLFQDQNKVRHHFASCHLTGCVSRIRIPTGFDHRLAPAAGVRRGETWRQVPAAKPKKGAKKPKPSWQLATSSAQRNALHDARRRAWLMVLWSSSSFFGGGGRFGGGGDSFFVGCFLWRGGGGGVIHGVSSFFGKGGGT